MDATGLCDECEQKIELIDDPSCRRCGCPNVTDPTTCPNCAEKPFDFVQDRTHISAGGGEIAVVVVLEAEQDAVLRCLIGQDLEACDHLVPEGIPFVALAHRDAEEFHDRTTECGGYADVEARLIQAFPNNVWLSGKITNRTLLPYSCLLAFLAHIS